MEKSHFTLRLVSMPAFNSTIQVLTRSIRRTMSGFTINDVPRISREELAGLVRQKHPDLTVIDVRDSDYVGGHIAGGINAPTQTHDYRMPELVRQLQDKESVVFHCALSQQRGPSSALNYLRERERLLGIKTNGTKKVDGPAGEAPAVKGQTVYVLDGGFVKWQEKYVPLLCYGQYGF